jgi:hypothetical protein
MAGLGKVGPTYLAFVVSSALAACGLYTPDKDPFTSNAPLAPDYKFSRQGSYESGLVDHVTCEISRGLAETVRQWPGVSQLALQLPFCFEVRTLSDRLVSSAPE